MQLIEGSTFSRKEIKHNQNNKNNNNSFSQREMSSKVIFTPLCGCYDNDPLCYLLQMDDIHILLDCGWDERFNINDSHIQQLKK